MEKKKEREPKILSPFGNRSATSRAMSTLLSEHLIRLPDERLCDFEPSSTPTWPESML
jgi:hypothetical protein